MTGRAITSTMARARGELAQRMGRRGVAVIRVCYNLQKSSKFYNPLFVLKNCVVSLVTFQNGTCEQLAIKATDF